MLKVSVIIPVYNAEKHLAQCLDSLLCQTLSDFEIICVDDGSSDNSPQLITEYSKRDDRVKLLSQKNSYAGVARNNGFKHAGGEYVMFLDADDFFEPEMLFEMYEKCVCDNADVCLCTARKYNDATGEYYSYQSYLLKTQFLPEATPFSAKDIALRIFNATTPVPWTKMFKRSFLTEAGVEFPSFKKAEDLYFTYAVIALANRITYIDKEFINYRVGNENSLEGKKSFTFDFYNSLMLLKKELTKRNLFTDFEQSFVNRALSSCFYELDKIAGDEAYKQEFISAAEEYKTKCFYNLNMLGHSRGYFYYKSEFERLVDFCEKSPEEYWRGLGAEKEAEEIKIDIEKWIAPIEIKHGGDIKVSVIIPVYNMEEYVGRCVESVLENTLREVEIICVDDGSSDSSPEILRAFAERDGRVRVVTKENGGLSSARNAGIREAKGEYLLFLDSDDYIEKRALEYLYAEASAKGLDDLFFNARCFNDADDSDADVNYSRRADYSGVSTGREMFVKMSDNAEFKPSVCMQFIRREFINENKIEFINGILYEDNPFTLECLFKASRVRFDNINLYNRRVRKGSIMASSCGVKASYNYYMIINHVKALAQRCKFAQDKEFYRAFLKQLERIRSVAVDFLGDVSDDEFLEFISTLDEESAVDYYFYVKTAKAYGKKIKENSRNAKLAREKAVMDGAKQKCKNLDDKSRAQAEIDKKSAQINSLKEQITALKAQVTELREKTLKGKIKKIINK